VCAMPILEIENGGYLINIPANLFGRDMLSLSSHNISIQTNRLGSSVIQLLILVSLQSDQSS
jgi:hypothetical protein